jgi:hypothetical protein
VAVEKAAYLLSPATRNPRNPQSFVVAATPPRILVWPRRTRFLPQPDADVDWEHRRDRAKSCEGALRVINCYGRATITPLPSPPRSSKTPCGPL